MPIWAICTSRQNQNSLDKIKGQIVLWRILSRFLHPLKNFKNPRVSRQKKVNAYKANFSEFNNKLVAVFTTNGFENSVYFHCFTFFILLWMLKNTFTTFSASSQVFWCLEHTNNCFIFSKSALRYLKPLQSLLSMNK